MKSEKNVDKWRGVWEGLQRHDSRIIAAKCEEAVTKVLPSLNGVVRLHEAQQGEASYIEDIVNGILVILRPEKFVRFRFGVDPYKKFVGVERLCKVFLDEYQALEDPRSTYDDDNNSIEVCILGMYGVPGSGKSTICDFLLEYMFEDFSGNVIRLELPAFAKREDDLQVNIKEQYRKFLSMFRPYRKDFSSMDLDEMNRQLLGASVNHKMFLVFDNISPSNYGSYKTMVHAILSSTILGSGSRVMFVAHTKEILEKLLREVNLINRHTITEIPCLTEEEATELIRHWYPSLQEDVLTCLLGKCSFQHSSFMYVPFVLEQIAVLLREKRCNDVNELELLWKMVSESKKNVIKKLLEINLEQLPKDLKLLFLDIALFIVPAGYSKLSDAIPILCSMHAIDMKDSFKLEWKIMDLQQQCALSVIGSEKLSVHDIFTEYFRSDPEHSRSYVKKVVLLPVTDSARQQYGQHRAHAVQPRKLHLMCSEARTIHIIICECKKSGHDQDQYPLVSDGEEDISSYHQEIRLLMRLDVKLQVRATTQALLIENSSRWCKCTFGLSGDLSSLVCFRMKNVRQIAFTLSGTDVDLSRLVRLEFKNESITRDTWMTTWRGGQRMNQFLDFMGSRFQNTTESIMWLLKPVLPYERREQLPASCDRLLSDFVLSGRMTQLRVLILVNAGIRRLENVGGCCPQLEVLKIGDEEQHVMDISVGNAPNLKRLVAGEDCVQVKTYNYEAAYFYRFHLNKIRHRNSRKLALRIAECPQLQEVYVDGSFNEITVVGLLPSGLRYVHLGSGSRPQFIPANLISTSMHQLSLLETLRLSCKKLERLNFTRQCSEGGLPCLRELHLETCDNLTHLSMEPGYMPNLVKLNVTCCDKLDVFEGVQDTLSMEQLIVWRLAGLPRLQTEIDVEQGTIPRNGLQLNEIGVTGCPGVRLHLNFGSMRRIMLKEVGIGEEVERSEEDDDDDDKGILTKADKRSIADEWEALLTSLTFLEGRFRLLKVLMLREVPHLREIEGFQHLPELEWLSLQDLPHLVRVSGTWSTTLSTLQLVGCVMLEEIPPLEQMPELRILSCSGCPKLKSVVCWNDSNARIKITSNTVYSNCMDYE